MSNVRTLKTLLLACCAVTGLSAAAGAVDMNAARGAWMLEKGVAEPSYAVADATRSNLNVETVVLACEAAADSRLLQIQLYLSDEGPLQPTYKHSAALKDEPKAVVSIDGKDFPVALMFADDHVVLADAQDGPMPMLSDALTDAMQAGKVMTIKVDLLADAPGGAPTDGETVINLQGPGGREAVAAVRRCAEPAHPNVAELQR